MVFLGPIVPEKKMTMDLSKAKIVKSKKKKWKNIRYFSQSKKPVIEIFGRTLSS